MSGPVAWWVLGFLIAASAGAVWLFCRGTARLESVQQRAWDAWQAEHRPGTAHEEEIAQLEEQLKGDTP